MPDDRGARLERTRPLGHNALVIARPQKEAERCEEVHDCVEPARPLRRKTSHVTASVAKRFPGSPQLCTREQVAGQIEPVDVITCLGEQMCVAALPARHVENPRSSRQPEYVDEPSDLTTIAGEIEDRAVFEEVLGVEVLRPPVALRAGTGGRS